MPPLNPHPGTWLIRSFPLRIIAVTCLALALLLEAAYTTWVVNSQFREGCAIIRAQAVNPGSSEQLRHLYVVLGKRRGCG